MVRTLSIAVVVAALAACSKAEAPAPDSATATKSLPDSAASMPASPAGATVAMRDAAGRELGSLMVMEAAGGLSLHGTLSGLPPGEHAIHLHTVGQCAAPFETAGPHWNPTGKKHGSQNPAGPHLGDMPNFTVGADSTASVNVTTAGGTLRGADALLDADGASVVIHAGPDDLKTDPAGNSGAKIACGVVTGG